jgi:DNA polymerase-3 subunit gamma/tau
VLGLALGTDDGGAAAGDAEAARPATDGAVWDAPGPEAAAPEPADEGALGAGDPGAGAAGAGACGGRAGFGAAPPPVPPPVPGLGAGVPPVPGWGAVEGVGEGEGRLGGQKSVSRHPAGTASGRPSELGAADAPAAGAARNTARTAAKAASIAAAGARPRRRDVPMDSRSYRACITSRAAAPQ